MNFTTIKKYRKKHKLLGSLLLKNPVLVLGLDLPFVIATSTSLRSAVAMAIQIFIIHMVTVAVGTITCRKLSPLPRAMVNAGVSTIAMMFSRTLIVLLFKGVSNTLGMYLYISAVNGMTMLQAGSIGKKDKFLPVMYSAFLNAMGLALVMCVAAVFREFFGNGTIWGIQLTNNAKLAGLSLPFGGFIVMAFVLAFAKFLNKKLLYWAAKDNARKEAQYAKIRVISEEII